MTSKQKRRLRKIIISICLFLIFFITDLVLAYKVDGYDGLESIIKNDKYGWLLPFALYFSLFIYIGKNILKKAFLNIIHLQVLDENFLMVIACVASFSLGIYKSVNNLGVDGFEEACAVIIFYEIGEWFQSYAVNKSRKSIKSLMNIRADYANLVYNDIVKKVKPEDLKIGDTIVIYPGEKIAVDGTVLKGNSYVDCKAITGESMPVEVSANTNLISGSVNLSETIYVRVDKLFTESTVSKILSLVENASSRKSASEKFITKFAKFYTPIVVGLALLLAVIPSVITKDYYKWIYRSLSFLVVSCPCALVISIPLTFFSAIGKASSNGILVKGSVFLEKYNKANVFVFDKTGTLTKGTFKIDKIVGDSEVLKLAAIAEADSSHPIALSIKTAYGDIIDNNYTLKNISGMGIVATNNVDTIYCGNEKLMEKFNISYVKQEYSSTVLYVAKNKEYKGAILISDVIKEEAYDTIKYLNNYGKTIMFTGDNDKVANQVFKELNINEYKSSLLPQDKVSCIKEYLNNENVVCFLGDGINDAPVLINADIGIGMGAIGSDAAIEASDIVLMNDDLTLLKRLKKISKRTMLIVYENIIFALFVKVLILVLSMFGITNMWLAMIGDVGVAIIAILNATRKYKIT